MPIIRNPDEFFPHGTRDRDSICKTNLSCPCHVESEKILEKLVSFLPQNGNYFEYGSWGASTACYVSDKRPNATIIAADIWDEVKRAILAVINRSVRPNVMFWCGPAEVFLQSCTMKFDVMFIDALHEYKPQYESIVQAYPHLKEHGVLCVHDYKSKKSPDVEKAVHDFINRYQFKIVDVVDTLVCLKS